jgi:hypothetical protein
MLKEQAKLSAAEQARLEVEAFENAVDVLLSVHKEVRPRFDWFEPLSALPPHAPRRTEEEAALASALAAHDQERAEWQKMRSLAKRVLAGEAAAYGEALRELHPFGELSTLGSSIAFRVHHRGLVECELRVNGLRLRPAGWPGGTGAFACGCGDCHRHCQCPATQHGHRSGGSGALGRHAAPRFRAARFRAARSIRLDGELHASGRCDGVAQIG